MSSVDDVLVAESVRLLLAFKNETQRDLAAIINHDPGDLSRKMNATRSWTDRDIELMAEHFGVPSQLLGSPRKLVAHVDEEWFGGGR
jgi:hypothetical protein